MENKNVTLISTVYNEDDTIEDLLESIEEQSRVPDEVVFVDGGSEDSTFEILKEWEGRIEGLRAIQRDGCNIAEGRNIAVREASNDLIVGTDGGCILDENWFEGMASKFEEGYEYVIGMFKPIYDNLFEKVQGELVCSSHTVEELEKGNRGPSSRSVGFSKEAWRAAGGYPEDLYTGEDSKFNHLVMSSGYEPGIAGDAFVYWRMRPSWKDFFKQFYRYGEGDARGGNLFTHPSKKLGITKNFWLLSQSFFTIIMLLLTGYSYYTGMAGLPVYAGLFLAGLVLPVLYYGRTLWKVLKEDGLKGLRIGLGLSETKSWGWFLGFTKEIIKKPKLMFKQFREAF